MERETFRAECDRRRDAGLILFGDTYAIRQQIKDAGGIWDKRLKAWLLPSMDSILAVTNGKIARTTCDGLSAFELRDGDGGNARPEPQPAPTADNAPAAPAVTVPDYLPADIPAPPPVPAANDAAAARLDPRGLFAELSRRAENARDYLVSLGDLIVNEEDGLTLREGDEPTPCQIAPFAFTSTAAGQIIDKVSGLKHARRYWRQLLAEHPAVAAQHLDMLAEARGQRGDKDRILIRVLDGKVRAVLSSSYRSLDNHDLGFAVLDAADKTSAELLDGRVTDDHLYLRLVDRDTVERITPPTAGWDGASDHQFRGFGAHRDDDGGVTCHPTVTISNSETGCGSLKAEIGIFISGCSNGMIVTKALTQVHLGKKRTAADGLLIGDATKRLEDRVVFAKVRDIVANAFDPERFKAIVAKLSDLQADKIEDASRAVDDVATKLALGDERRKQLLDKFASNAEPTRFGLLQAATEVAQEWGQEDYATQVEVERWAGAQLCA